MACPPNFFRGSGLKADSCTSLQSWRILKWNTVSAMLFWNMLSTIRIFIMSGMPRWKIFFARILRLSTMSRWNFYQLFQIKLLRILSSRNFLRKWISICTPRRFSSDLNSSICSPCAAGFYSQNYRKQLAASRFPNELKIVLFWIQLIALNPGISTSWPSSLKML